MMLKRLKFNFRLFRLHENDIIKSAYKSVKMTFGGRVKLNKRAW